MFLLGSISKPICVTALMTLFDRGAFKLDDPLHKFIPKFTGEGRERVTMQHLLTHVSGLPDQLPENDSLRKKHAPLAEFAEHAIRTQLSFTPGSRYRVFQHGDFAGLASRRDHQRRGYSGLYRTGSFAAAGHESLTPGARAVCLSGYGADADGERRANRAGVTRVPKIGIGTAPTGGSSGAPWGGTHCFSTGHWAMAGWLPFMRRGRSSSQRQHE